MKVKIENTYRPAELQIVTQMLTNQKIPIVSQNQTTIEIEVPNEKWFLSLKEAIEFMTHCKVTAT